VNHKILPLVTALLWLGSAPAFGETVTLREAINRALEQNHLLKAASYRQGAAQQEAAASRSRYLPRVYLESGALLSNTPSKVFMMKLDEGRIDPGSDFAASPLNDPSARGDFRTALTLEQPLLDFSVSTGAQLAAREAESAEFALEGSRDQLAYRVYLAFLAVRRARAFHDIADQAVANAREHLRLAQLREKDGVGLKSDQLRGATALSEAEQRLISARNDLLLARLRLNLAVGGRQGEALDIEGSADLAEPASSPPELVEQAHRNRPELKVAQKAVEKGDLALRLAREAYLPTVYAGATYQVNDRDNPLGWDHDSWSVGVNLRWDLFDGSRRSHVRRQAELARQATAELLENERREVAFLVTESALRRQEAAMKLESARAALQAAEEGRRLVSLRFQNGLSPMVELMDAESALNRARANLVEVENGYLGATGELYYQAGLFLKEVMR
jgi:outer membrane protein TolC